MPQLSDKADGREQIPLGQRRLSLILVVLCGTSLLTAVLAFDKLPSTIGDNAEFAILGKAVSMGEGMRYINHPAERPSTKYPPGVPLLLALWIKLFGDSMVVLKVEVLVIFILTVVVSFLLARRFIDESLSTIAALLMATSASVLAYSHEVLSEIPYAFFSLTGLLLLIDGERKKLALGIGILVCIWAYVVRTAGVSLIVAAGLFLWLRSRRREAILLVCACAAFTIAWTLRNRHLAGEGSRYLSVLLSANPYDPDRGLITFAGLVRRIGTNLGAYVSGLLPGNLFPTLIVYRGGSGAVALRTVISVITLGVAFLGGYALRKRALLLNLYLAAYAGIYLVWPEVWRSERFMLPVAPIVAIYFLRGVAWIVRYFGPKKLATVVVCTVLLATNLFSLSSYIARPRGYPPGWRNYFTTATWVKQNTDPNSLVLCRSPFLFYIASQRKTITYPFTRDAEAMKKYLYEWKPDYIVIDDVGFSTTATYLLPVLRGMLDEITPVYTTEQPVNAVLKFKPRGSGKP